MSRVVVIKHKGDIPPGGLSRVTYTALLTTGIQALAGKNDLKQAIGKYIPPGVVGMKTNCIAGKLNSTPVALTDALSQLLTEAGFDENDLVVWERTSRELVDAGYTLNASVNGRRCLGTDANGVGHSRVFYSSGDVSSLVTRVLTDIVDHNVNLPVLKDHSIAGLSAGMKNMFGAIHNPNKGHSNNCDPFCAHVSNLGPIKGKNRLTILDATRVQYNGGPGYVSEHVAVYNGIVISDDPVALDRVSLEILEKIRKASGLPSLEMAGRPVKYLKSAEALGLGQADMSQIKIEVVHVDDDGPQRAGELL